MNPSSLPNASYFPGGVRAPVGAIPGPPGMDLNRRKQINTLRIFNEGVSEVRADTQYQVDFQLSDEATDAFLQVQRDWPRRSLNRS